MEKFFRMTIHIIRMQLSARAPGLKEQTRR